MHTYWDKYQFVASAMREFLKHYAMVSTMDGISETFIDFNDNMDPSVLVW